MSARVTVRVGHFDIGYWSLLPADQTRREMPVPRHKEHISWRIHGLHLYEAAGVTPSSIRTASVRMIAGLSLLLLHIHE